jgi:hypothetical protein
LSSRPELSRAFRPTQGDETRHRGRHQFVISTGAKRSGEICGFVSSHTPSKAPEAVFRRAELFNELHGQAASPAEATQ